MDLLNVFWATAILGVALVGITVFPTQVGVNRGDTATGHADTGVPHAGGGEP